MWVRSLVILLLCGSMGSAFVAPRARSGLAVLRAVVDVADPSSVLQNGLAALCVLSTGVAIAAPIRKLPPLLSACLFAFLTVYVHDRSSTLQYQFTDTKFEVARVEGGKMNLNPLFGTPYSYTLNNMGGFTFLPSSQLPVFLYITEGDCPVERRIPSPVIVVDDAAPSDSRDQGQVHLFPLIASPEAVRRGLLSRGVPEMARPRVSLQPDAAKLLQGLQLL